MTTKFKWNRKFARNAAALNIEKFAEKLRKGTAEIPVSHTFEVDGQKYKISVEFVHPKRKTPTHPFGPDWTNAVYGR